MLTVIDIINNKDNTYPGDLKHYFKAVFNAPNKNAPYHNLRHMLHVTWATYYGAMYYGDKISPRHLRNMLIAALFHDYDHVGKVGNDAENIKAALVGLNFNLMEEDREWDNLHMIVRCIAATEFPHKDGLWGLPQLIVRDADIAYTLSDVWIQTVTCGLSEELGITAEQMLKGQEPFLRSLKFGTEWGNNEYGHRIENRITEAKQMVETLYN
jgi:hypothetical protein